MPALLAAADEAVVVDEVVMFPVKRPATTVACRATLPAIVRTPGWRGTPDKRSTRLVRGTAVASIVARWDIFPVIVPSRLETNPVTTVVRMATLLVTARSPESKPYFLVTKPQMRRQSERSRRKIRQMKSEIKADKWLYSFCRRVSDGLVSVGVHASVWLIGRPRGVQ